MMAGDEILDDEEEDEKMETDGGAAKGVDDVIGCDDDGSDDVEGYTEGDGETDGDVVDRAAGNEEDSNKL